LIAFQIRQNLFRRNGICHSKTVLERELLHRAVNHPELIDAGEEIAVYFPRGLGFAGF